MDTWSFMGLISSVLTKKKHPSSSGESIENLLYYKDCKHKQNTSPAPVILRAETPKPACPCPRVCCSMCCECETPASFMSRQMQPLQQQSAMPMPVPQQPPMSMMPALRSAMDPMNTPIQPQIQRPNNKKRGRFMGLRPPGNRRDLGFTKDDIKNLISRDEEIKKILNNLVKVTMEKVETKDGKRVFTPTEAAREVVDEDYE